MSARGRGRRSGAPVAVGTLGIGRVARPQGEEPLCLSLSLKLSTGTKSGRREEDQSAFLLITGQHLPATAPAQPPAVACFNGFYSHERAVG